MSFPEHLKTPKMLLVEKLVATARTLASASKDLTKEAEKLLEEIKVEGHTPML